MIKIRHSSSMKTQKVKKKKNASKRWKAKFRAPCINHRENTRYKPVFSALFFANNCLQLFTFHFLTGRFLFLTVKSNKICQINFIKCIKIRGNCGKNSKKKCLVSLLVWESFDKTKRSKHTAQNITKQTKTHKTTTKHAQTTHRFNLASSSRLALSMPLFFRASKLLKNGIKDDKMFKLIQTN